MTQITRDFEQFCLQHPTRTFEHEGLTWRYRVAGNGTQGLLLFPGAVGDGDVYFALVPRLVEIHRVVSFAYPDAITITQLVAGIRAVVTHEGLASVDVIGGSFGGLVAQSLLQSAPTLLRRVVLSATGAAKRARARTNARAASVVGVMPLAVTRALLKWIVRLTTRKVTVDRQFWRDVYFEAIAKTPKSSLRCRYLLGSDFDLHGPISADDVRAWTGEMLILNGGEDAIAHSSAQDGLTAIYPRARRHTFVGAGHGIALERPVEWAEVVSNFLTGSRPATPPDK